MQSDTTGSLQEFHKILEEAGKKGASDIHYVPKEQLLLRIDGRLVDMTEEWNVSFSMEELIEKLLDKKQQKTFEENGEVEFSCPVFNKRVRVNLFRQSGTCAMSVLFSSQPSALPTPEVQASAVSGSSLRTDGQTLHTFHSAGTDSRGHAY